MQTQLLIRCAVGAATAGTALLLLAGCDRSPSDMPPPSTDAREVERKTTPTPAVPPASAITPSPSTAPLAPPGTPGPAAPSEGAPSGGATGK